MFLGCPSQDVLLLVSVKGAMLSPAAMLNSASLLEKARSTAAGLSSQGSQVPATVSATC